MSNEPNIWPPPPSVQPASAQVTPTKKRANTADILAVLFVSFIALCIGLGAGGHKDFSESLLANVGLALLDLGLWSLCVVYWFVFLKKKWIALGSEPSRLKKSLLIASAFALIGIYGSGASLSLWLLTIRAAYSDTTY